MRSCATPSRAPFPTRTLAPSPRLRIAVLIAAAIIGGLASTATGQAAPVGSSPMQEQELYRTLTLRAAPGQLGTVTEMLRERMPVWHRVYGAGPWWMRHSQGDQWDLLLLFPLGRGFDEWYGDDAVARRRALRLDEPEVAFQERLLPHIAWREELFVWGPSAAEVAERFDGAGYFHVEMFVALPGKRAELVAEREMENAYLQGIGRDPNLIFTRAGGAPWDSYTLGFYRDLKHYAESADIPLEVEEQAAIAAGFEGVASIGFYLRSLIARHQDTLATAIR